MWSHVSPLTHATPVSFSTSLDAELTARRLFSFMLFFPPSFLRTWNMTSFDKSHLAPARLRFHPSIPSSQRTERTDNEEKSHLKEIDISRLVEGDIFFSYVLLQILFPQTLKSVILRPTLEQISSESLISEFYQSLP